MFLWIQLASSRSFVSKHYHIRHAAMNMSSKKKSYWNTSKKDSIKIIFWNKPLKLNFHVTSFDLPLASYHPTNYFHLDQYIWHPLSCPSHLHTGLKGQSQQRVERYICCIPVYKIYNKQWIWKQMHRQMQLLTLEKVT